MDDSLLTPQLETALGEDKVLRQALSHVSRRLRFARWTRCVSRGALAAAVLAFCVMVVQHFLQSDRLSLPFVVFCLLLLGLGVGTAVAYARPIDLMTAARVAESRLDMKERLSSALEFERSTVHGHDPEALLLLRLQQQDAAAHATAMQLDAAVPIKMPWEAKAGLAAWIAIWVALSLPSLPFMTSPALRAERAVVQKSGTGLADAARRLEKQADAAGLPETARAARQMATLANRMQNRHLDKRQAMAALAQTDKQVAEQQRRQAQAIGLPQSGKTLSQAGDQLSKSSDDTRSAPRADDSELRDTTRALQHGDGNGLSRQMRALAQHPTAVSNSGNAPKNAQDLQRLANALQRTPLSDTQRHVQAASDAAKRGDQAEASSEMRQAADSAARETSQQSHAQRDAQGLQEARQTLQDSRQQMATPQNSPSNSAAPQNTPSGSAASPTAQARSGRASEQGASNQHGQPNGAAQGQQQPGPGQRAGTSGQPGPGQTGSPSRLGTSSGQGEGSHSGGAPSNGGGGSGKAAAANPGQGQYSPSSRIGQQTPTQPAGIVHGAAHPLGAGFNPSHNPSYGQIFLGRGSGNSTGAASHSLSGGLQHPAADGVGTVPYSNEIAPARKTAETAMDREDIPPSYRNDVQRYFDALQPHAAK